MKYSIRKKYAKIVKNEDIKLMLYIYSIKNDDWRGPSALNPSLSKGKMWNVLAANFDVNKTYVNGYKYNLLKEYDSCMPANEDLTKLIYEEYNKTKIKNVVTDKVPYYEEPNLENYKNI